jgi:hypothetical protein
MHFNNLNFIQSVALSYLFLYLSTYIRICVSTRPAMYLFIYVLPIYLHIYLLIYLFIYLFTHSFILRASTHNANITAKFTHD